MGFASKWGISKLWERWCRKIEIEIFDKWLISHYHVTYSQTPMNLFKQYDELVFYIINLQLFKSGFTISINKGRVFQSWASLKSKTLGPYYLSIIGRENTNVHIKLYFLLGCLRLQKESILRASWPASGKVDEILMRASDYLENSAHDFRLRLKAAKNPGKGKVIRE